MASVHIIVRPRSSATKTAPLPVDLPASSTLLELRKEIAKAWRLSLERQRLTVEGSKVPLQGDEKTLKQLGLSGKAVVLVKDLGPQIAWRTTFVIEYLGPILIHPIFYFFGRHIYPLAASVAPRGMNITTFEHSRAQQISFALIMFHFIKRELETMLYGRSVFLSAHPVVLTRVGSLHRFSNGTMAVWRIFLNSSYYWGVSGVLLAAALYSPWNSAKEVKGTLIDNDANLIAFTALWVFSILSNFYTHVQLASLRPKGTKDRNIPYGYGFHLVSCPNYFFEILGWVALCGLTHSFFAVTFATIGVIVMNNWAHARHRRYKKEFGKQYPAHRTPIFPFVP